MFLMLSSQGQGHIFHPEGISHISLSCLKSTRPYTLKIQNHIDGSGHFIHFRFIHFSSFFLLRQINSGGMLCRCNVKLKYDSVPVLDMLYQNQEPLVKVI